MINVNQTMALLAQMPDASLKQYAQMHKDDPYMVSLALAEFNRRKQMRGAASAQGAPQRTVVEQELGGADALPENVGIGRLPADNLKGMATGGIVAFSGAEGSLVDDVQTQLENLRVGAPADMSVFSPTYGYGVRPPTKRMDASTDPRVAQMLASQQPPLSPTGPDLRRDTSTDPRVFYMQQSLQPYANGSGASFNFGTPDVERYIKRYMGELNSTTPTKESLMRDNAEVDAPVSAKWLDMIDKQKKQLKTDAEQNFYMSLIHGGLAAAGATGPNALQNLAQGLGKGAEHYGQGLADLRKAAQENAKMELAQAQYEATGKKEALKTYHDAQKAKQTAIAQGMSSMYGHDLSGRYGLAAAGIHASAVSDRTGAEERLTERYMRDPAFADAYNKLKQTATLTKKETLSKDVAYAEWAKNLALQHKNPNFEAYYAGLIGTPAQGSAKKPDFVFTSAGKLVPTGN